MLRRDWGRRCGSKCAVFLRPQARRHRGAAGGYEVPDRDRSEGHHPRKGNECTTFQASDSHETPGAHLARFDESGLAVWRLRLEETLEAHTKITDERIEEF